MRKNDVAVVGVMHPGIAKYLNSYFDSLEVQTFKDFDLILFNDGLSVEKTFFKKFTLNTILQEISGTPGEIRHKLIHSVLNAGYEFIVFSDCDDFYSRNRLEICVNLLDRSHIIVNDLDIVSENGETQQHCYFSNRLDEGRLIEFRDLLNCNMMGFTNTATRREVLSDCLPFLDINAIAFDWLLWTYALWKGNSAKFTSLTSSKYRVYPGNIAGIPQKINKEQVLRGISVKSSHHREFVTISKEHQDMYDSFSKVEKDSQDIVWLNDYILALKENEIETPMWWENIRIPKEVGLL